MIFDKEPLGQEPRLSHSYKAGILEQQLLAIITRQWGTSVWLLEGMVVQEPLRLSLFYNLILAT